MRNVYPRLCIRIEERTRDSMRKYALLAFFYPLSASSAVFFIKNNIVIFLDATLRVQEVNSILQYSELGKSEKIEKD